VTASAANRNKQSAGSNANNSDALSTNVVLLD
jgi:hypothetical protein